MVRFVEDDGGEEPLAPVIPLFGTGHGVDRPVSGPAVTAPGVEPARPRDVGGRASDAEATDGAAEAERVLLKRLRLRSLSIREARAVLAAEGLDAEAADELVERFCERGYLDDARLAEQLVYAGVDRKRQGRQAIAQTLAKRGVPREIADEALDALPDDDDDRALDYARSKAASLVSLDRDTALRRLIGQLARRGFPGSVAMRAAGAALDEAGAARGGSGVRFR
ncbi:regulatory protein RecX [Microbacterium sp. SORGH_AS_0888]|uniref:regulatory protein RecX n=1 Tax=Microbacterium sp. SORGH_AS_0888 TaxID=3041791 RepID=UPI0027880F88|nr:regulatory protein RecX [Microbacterium sp. SORGH_AS_0888]MDQ1129082.1 regulatory protein [Microbacterium sp. SORGH_AS_0888]